VNPGAGTAALLRLSLASGFIAATVRPDKFPLCGADSSRTKFLGPAGPSLRCGPGTSFRDAARPDPHRSDHAKAAMGADLAQPRKDFIMSTIGNFSASGDGYTGTVRTLTLNVKVRIAASDKGSDNAPDYRVVAGNGLEIGAAWKKISKAERPYLSVTLDDPSFPATIYARLVEGEDGAHNLIWSRSKGD